MMQTPASSLHANDRGTAFLRLPEVCRRVALSRSSIYAAIAAGTFPAPVRLGSNSVGWVSSEVEAWIAARIAGREARGPHVE